MLTSRMIQMMPAKAETPDITAPDDNSKIGRLNVQ